MSAWNLLILWKRLMIFELTFWEMFIKLAGIVITVSCLHTNSNLLIFPEWGFHQSLLIEVNCSSLLIFC